MFTRIIVLSCFVMFSSGGIARAEFPEQVKRIVETTTYETCSIVRMVGARVDPFQEVTEDSITVCGNSFLISQNEVLTNDHVLDDPIIMVFDYFERAFESYKRTGMAPRYLPKRIDRIDFYVRLSSSDKDELRSDVTTFSTRWDGELSKDAVYAFLESIKAARKEYDTASPRFTVVARDTRKDLALIRLARPEVRPAYVKIENFRPHPGETAWGYSLTSSFLKGASRALVVEGSFVGVENGMLVLVTLTQNRIGMSGSATVDALARLVGVTCRITATEHSWSQKEPHPCNVSAPCKRWVVTPAAVIEFLNEARKKY